MPRSYTVRPNDTLSAIAARYGVSYQEIAKANKIADPNRIYPGQTFNIPDKPGSVPAPTPQSAPSVSPQLSASVQSSGQPQSAQDLINRGYTGYQGWGNAEALADFKATGGQGKGGSSGPATTAQPSISLPARPAAPDLSGLYTRSIEESTKAVQPEIQAAQGKLTEVQARIEQKRRSLAEAEANINDNPYYSEATRVGRIAKLREKAQQDIAIDETEAGIAQSGITLAENKLSTAKADAQVKLNIAAQEYNIKSSEYQQNLQLFTNLLTSGALETASGADIAQVTTATGMSSSMVQSIIDFQKKKNVPNPSLVTTDDGTNQYVVAIDPKTGNVIQKQVIGKSAPKTLTQTQTEQGLRAQVAQALNSKAGSDGYVSQEVYLAARNQWTAMGNTAADFDKAFSNYVNPKYWETYNIVDPDTVKRLRGY